jgi:phosphodiesterase/alkaline phosphatase D-like protein
MNTLLLKRAMTVLVGGLLYSTPAATQESTRAKTAPSVRITQGPEIERAQSDYAIVRWTTNKPAGSPVHHGIVLFGTEPTNLSRTARSPIRLNPGHRHTVFRVLIGGLAPHTTYYYKVDSEGSAGKSDGVKSPVKSFTTPPGP